MSVGPRSRVHHRTWWILVWLNGTSQSGWAQVRCMARSARRWARLTVRAVRPRLSGTPSPSSAIGMISASQQSRRTVDTGSGTPSSVSQIPPVPPSPSEETDVDEHTDLGDPQLGPTKHGLGVGAVGPGAVVMLVGLDVGADAVGFDVVGFDVVVAAVVVAEVVPVGRTYLRVIGEVTAISETSGDRIDEVACDAGRRTRRRRRRCWCRC
jgi:hypothetical protein